MPIYPKPKLPTMPIPWEWTKLLLKPAGEWNSMEVTAVGPTVKVVLNGALILDADLSKVTEFVANKPHPGKDRTSGHFGFAGHGHAVEFRSIRIKPLAALPAEGTEAQPASPVKPVGKKSE